MSRYLFAYADTQRIDVLLGEVDARLATWVSGAAIEDGDALAQALRRLASTWAWRSNLCSRWSSGTSLPPNG